MSFRSLGFTFRMGKSTVRQIVNETCEAMWNILQPIHMPQPTEEIFKNIANDFWNLWQFPNCVGAIDGKHIRIKCPQGSGSLLYNYKKISIVLQGISDANYKFITIEVGGYGKQSDGGTFSSSQLYNLIRNYELRVPNNAALPGTTVFATCFYRRRGISASRYTARPYSRQVCSIE